MLIETTTQDYYILCPKYGIEKCNYVGCYFLKHPEQIINVWKRGLRKGFLHKSSSRTMLQYGTGLKFHFLSFFLIESTAKK